MEWTEIQRRADIHGNGASVHAVQSLLRWMGELFNAPTWSQATSGAFTNRQWMRNWWATKPVENDF